MHTIHVVMFSTSHIEGYASLSATINHRYCQYHGYAFTHFQYDDVELGPTYEKVRILKLVLGTADHVFWIDSDACFIDFRKPLGDFIFDNSDLVLSGHQYGFDLAGEPTQYVLNGQRCGVKRAHYSSAPVNGLSHSWIVGGSDASKASH